MKQEIAFHGTSEEAWKKIQVEGLRGAFGFVYMTPDLNFAKRYGEVVLEIDLAMLNKNLLGTYPEMMCRIMKTDDFIHYGADIPPEAITRI